MSTGSGCIKMIDKFIEKLLDSLDESGSYLLTTKEIYFLLAVLGDYKDISSNQNNILIL